MSKKCKITGTIPMYGNTRSHAMNASKRKFFSNLHKHRFWLESQHRFIKLSITAKGIRLINKKGIDTILTNINKNN